MGVGFRGGWNGLPAQAGRDFRGISRWAESVYSKHETSWIKILPDFRLQAIAIVCRQRHAAFHSLVCEPTVPPMRDVHTCVGGTQHKRSLRIPPIHKPRYIQSCKQTSVICWYSATFGILWHSSVELGPRRRVVGMHRNGPCFHTGTQCGWSVYVMRSGQFRWGFRRTRISLDDVDNRPSQLKSSSILTSATASAKFGSPSLLSISSH